MCLTDNIIHCAKKSGYFIILNMKRDYDSRETSTDAPPSKQKEEEEEEQQQQQQVPSMPCKRLCVEEHDRYKLYTLEHASVEERRKRIRELDDIFISRLIWKSVMNDVHVVTADILAIMANLPEDKMSGTLDATIVTILEHAHEPWIHPKVIDELLHPPLEVPSVFLEPRTVHWARTAVLAHVCCKHDDTNWTHNRFEVVLRLLLHTCHRKEEKIQLLEELANMTCHVQPVETYTFVTSALALLRKCTAISLAIPHLNILSTLVGKQQFAIYSKPLFGYPCPSLVCTYGFMSETKNIVRLELHGAGYCSKSHTGPWIYNDNNGRRGQSDRWCIVTIVSRTIHDIPEYMISHDLKTHDMLWGHALPEDNGAIVNNMSMYHIAPTVRHGIHCPSRRIQQHGDDLLSIAHGKRNMFQVVLLKTGTVVDVGPFCDTVNADTPPLIADVQQQQCDEGNNNSTISFSVFQMSNLNDNDNAHATRYISCYRASVKVDGNAMFLAPLSRVPAPHCGFLDTVGRCCGVRDYNRLSVIFPNTGNIKTLLGVSSICVKKGDDDDLLYCTDCNYTFTVYKLCVDTETIESLFAIESNYRCESVLCTLEQKKKKNKKQPHVVVAVNGPRHIEMFAISIDGSSLANIKHNRWIYQNLEDTALYKFFVHEHTMSLYALSASNGKILKFSLDEKKPEVVGRTNRGLGMSIEHVDENGDVIYVFHVPK